jgi:metallo-beta-lactamase class B
VQIVPGIYLVNGAPYGRHQNSYLISSGNAKILVDAGDLSPVGIGNGRASAASCLPELEANAARWGVRFEEVSHLFVTHAHFDHASHAKALQERGMTIVASPEAAEAMAAGDERCIGYAHNRVFEPCVADVVLRDGEEMMVDALGVKCIAGPGHSDDSVVYEIDLDGERCWFIGDIFATKDVYGGLTIDEPWTGAPGFSREKSLETATKLLGYRCDHLFPGHGPATIGHGYALLERLLFDLRTRWQ